jgi:hypothetical protein
MKTESSDLDTAPSQGTAPTAKQRPSELRVALLTLVLPLYVSVGFAANYIGALHSPSPHDVKVAVVGAPAATAPLAHALTVKARGGLNVSQLSTVAPLPADNSSGTPNFFFLIICTLGTFLTVVALGFLAPTLPEPQRIAIVAAASVLAPLIAYLIGGAGYHTFSGDFGTVMAMLGMGALYAFAVACITRLLQLGLGPLGALVASALLIFLDLPSSGGSVAPQLMPGFWRFLNHFWIGAAGLDANRSVLYFHGAGVATDVLKILAWVAAWAALLAVPIFLRNRHRNSVKTAALAAEAS